MAMEDEFGISIPDDKIEEIKTVRDAVNYIRREPRGSN
jgi:acyl carrier protein